MFTGLIQDVGSVSAVDVQGGGTRLRIDTPLAADMGVGDSIAVNGACLTAEEVDEGNAVWVRAIPETLKRMALSELNVSQRVNLELALKASARLGGHFVQGHVDATARVLARKSEGESLRVILQLPDSFERYVIEKGSIALDGISLTVASIQGSEMEIALIPHTMKHTTADEWQPGRLLNVEADVLAKYVEKLLTTPRECP